MDKLDITPSPYLIGATNKAERHLTSLMHKLSGLPEAAERSISNELLRYVAVLADRERELVRLHVDQAFDLVMAGLASGQLELVARFPGDDKPPAEVTGALVVELDESGKIVGLELRPVPAVAKLTVVGSTKEDGQVEDDGRRGGVREGAVRGAEGDAGREDGRIERPLQQPVLHADEREERGDAGADEARLRGEPDVQGTAEPGGGDHHDTDARERGDGGV